MSANKKIAIILLVLLNINSLLGQEKNNKRNSLTVIESETNDERVEQLGAAIEEAIYEDAAKDYMSKMDKQGLGEKIIEKTKDDKSLSEYNEGFLEGFLNSLESLPKKLSNEITMGGYYSFVNYRYDEEDNTYYMLFRLYSEETGLNYHDYRVTEVNGNLKFNDLYIYLTGEDISKTLQRVYTITLPKKKLLSLLTGDDFTEFQNLVNSINLKNQGKFQESYDVLNSIEGKFADEKLILILKSQLAVSISDELYLSSLKEMIDKLPGDDTIYLNKLDYYTMLEDYDQVMALLDKLEKDTNDDFLNLLKGNIMFEKQDFEAAKGYFKYMVENYPDFIEGYSSYLSVLSNQEEFTEATKVLDVLITQGYEKTDLINFVEEVDANGQNLLDSLVESSEFKNWKK